MSCDRGERLEGHDEPLLHLVFTERMPLLRDPQLKGWDALAAPRFGHDRVRRRQDSRREDKLDRPRRTRLVATAWVAVPTV